MINWYVYIIESRTANKLYTGISNNPWKRLEKHNTGKGAKATRNGKPWTLAYVEIVETKREALYREAAIKKLSKEKKIALMQF